MATRKKPTEPFRLPQTVSKSALLVGKSDHTFRAFMYDVGYLGRLIDAVRREVANRLGLTPPQYNIVMAVGELMGTEGVSVSEVASYLHVAGTFVTATAATLVDLDFVEKAASQSDGRTVLLRLTAQGASRIEGIAELIRTVNDRFFGSLAQADLKQVSATVQALVRDGEQALKDISERDRVVRPLVRAQKRRQ